MQFETARLGHHLDPTQVEQDANNSLHLCAACRSTHLPSSIAAAWNRCRFASLWLQITGALNRCRHRSNDTALTTGSKSIAQSGTSSSRNEKSLRPGIPLRFSACLLLRRSTLGIPALHAISARNQNRHQPTTRLFAPSSSTQLVHPHDRTHVDQLGRRPETAHDLRHATSTTVATPTPGHPIVQTNGNDKSSTKIPGRPQCTNQYGPVQRARLTRSATCFESTPPAQFD